MITKQHAAVFLDRDGTVIADQNYARDPDGVRLLDGATDALGELQAAGLMLVVVSNQSGIGRGIIGPRQARAVHERFEQDLASHGVTLSGSWYCPHAPSDRCPCRKPAPGMLIAAAAALEIELGASFMIGDKDSDVEAGRAAGCRTILLGSRHSDRRLADHHARDWADAADFILAAKAAL